MTKSGSLRSGSYFHITPESHISPPSILPTLLNSSDPSWNTIPFYESLTQWDTCMPYMNLRGRGVRVMVYAVNLTTLAQDFCNGQCPRTLREHFHSFLHGSLTGMSLGSHHFSISISHSRKLGQTQNQAWIIPDKSLNSGALSCLVLHQAADKLHCLQF